MSNKVTHQEMIEFLEDAASLEGAELGEYLPL